MKLSRYHWVLYALLSAACVAVMASCVRIAMAELTQKEVVFFRCSIGLLLLIPLAARQKLSLRTGRPGLHLLRAVFGIAAMYSYFYAIGHLPLTDAVLLFYTSPLFVSLFAFLWLKEALSRRRKLAVFFGLIGVFLLFHPSSSIASPAGLVGLFSALFVGLAIISVKKLSVTEPSLRIVFIFSICACIISVLPVFGEFRFPSGKIWLWLLAIGMLGNLGQLSLAWAYRLAPASQVSPLGYSSLLFAGIIGYFIWHEIPDIWTAAGAILVVAAGMLVAGERIEPVPPVSPLAPGPPVI